MQKLPAHANYPPLKGEAIGAKNVGMEYYVMIYRLNLKIAMDRSLQKERSTKHKNEKIVLFVRNCLCVLSILIIGSIFSPESQKIMRIIKKLRICVKI